MTRGSRRNGNGARVAQAAVALGLVLVGSGCASAPPFRPIFQESYIVHVVFADVPSRGLCAVDVDTQVRNCNVYRPKGCLRARNRDKVTFRAVDAKGAPLPNDFEIRFDPFSSIKSVNGATPQPLAIDGPAAPDKGYHFRVYTAAVPPSPSSPCDPIDPQIIIEH